MAKDATTQDGTKKATETPPCGMIAQDRIEKATKTPFRVVFRLIWLGISGVVIYTVGRLFAGEVKEWYTGLSIGLLTAAAAMAFGGFFGFLFGVPRTSGKTPVPGPSQSGDNANTTNDNTSSRSAMSDKTRPNTNLEEISDWLTKILLGAGLTQLSKIPGKMGQLCDFVGAGLGGGDNNKVFAAATIVFFSICGFLAVFLWTRLYLGELLDHGVLGALIQRDDEQQKAIDEQQKAIEKNGATVRSLKAEQIINRALINPGVSEQTWMNEDRVNLEAAVKDIMARDQQRYSALDYLILAFNKYRTAKKPEDYQAPAKDAEKALNLKPTPEMLWETYCFLGLCYHYQQPKDWKPGGDITWMKKAIDCYKNAIKYNNNLDEELMAEANLAFVYLDGPQYDDCVNTVREVLNKDDERGGRIGSICDLARIPGAAAKVMLKDFQGAEKLLNDIEDITSFEYLFNTDDLPAEALKSMASLAGLTDEKKAFFTQVVQKLKL